MLCRIDTVGEARLSWTRSEFGSKRCGFLVGRGSTGGLGFIHLWVLRLYKEALLHHDEFLGLVLIHSGSM